MMKANGISLQHPKARLAGMAIGMFAAVRLGHMTMEEAEARLEQARRELGLE